MVPINASLAERVAQILTESNRLQSVQSWTSVLAMVLSALLACSLPAPAKASDPLRVSQSYWVDLSGLASLNDAKAAQLQPIKGTVSEGYKSAALWIKLDIEGDDSREPLAIIIQPPFLERIELYQVGDGAEQTITPRVTGRDIRPDAGNHVGLRSGFIIDPSPLPRAMYLRVSTSTTLTAFVSVMSLNEAMESDQRLEGLLATYVAFLIGFCIWGLVNWLIRREAIYGLFVFRQLYWLLFFFAFFGLFRFILGDHFSPAVRGFIYVFLAVTVVMVTGFFDLKLLSGFGVARPLRRLLGAALLLPVISIMLLLSGQPGAALQINTFIVNLIMILTCLLAFAVRDPEQERYGSLAIWIIRVGFALMTVVIVLPVLMHQNVIQTRLPAVNFIFLHALLSTCILVALLSIRARRRDLEAQEAVFRVQIKERELKEESLRRAEKEKFLSMLTHELRNPLGVIRLVVDTKTAGGQTIEKAAVDMAGVIERVEQSEKLDSQPPEFEMIRFNLSEFLKDLTRERPFSDRVHIACEESFAIRTDGRVLKSILRNLLDNAAKYSPPGSRIDLVASSNLIEGSPRCILEVVNRVGEAGVPERDRLYSKYYRNKRAQHQPGSGLGLFLVANWAKALGGDIAYELRSNGDGTELVSFKLWLPS